MHLIFFSWTPARPCQANLCEEDHQQGTECLMTRPCATFHIQTRDIVCSTAPVFTAALWFTLRYSLEKSKGNHFTGVQSGAIFLTKSRFPCSWVWGAEETDTLLLMLSLTWFPWQRKKWIGVLMMSASRIQKSALSLSIRLAMMITPLDMITVIQQVKSYKRNPTPDSLHLLNVYLIDIIISPFFTASPDNDL